MDASHLVLVGCLYFGLVGSIAIGIFYALAKFGKIVAAWREDRQRDKRAARLVVRFLEGIVWTTSNPEQQTEMAHYLWRRELLPSWVAPSELQDVPALAIRVRRSLEFWSRFGIKRRYFTLPSYVLPDLPLPRVTLAR